MSNSNWKEINEILIKGLKEVKKWCEDKRQKPLVSIFELIHFQEREPDGPLRYWPPLFSLTVSQSTSPFPRKEIDLPKEKSELRRSINKDFDGLSDSYLNEKTTSQLLLLLENLGDHLPAEGYDNKVSIYDAYKVKAIKTLLDSQNTEDAALIWGDLSGIQEFIFTIASEDALKNLRARSFFINLLEEHIIRKCLTTLNLPPTNVLFSGGGSFALISHWNEEVQEILKEIKFSLNKWLLDKLEGKLYVAIASTNFPISELKNNFPEVVKAATQKLFIEKRNKFREIIEKGDFSFVSDKDPSEDACNICYKDDEKLIEENEKEKKNKKFLCPLCKQLTNIGQQLPQKDFIGVRTNIHSERDIPLQIENTYYLLLDTPEKATCCIYKGPNSFFTALQHNIPLFYGDMYVTRIGDLPSDLLEKIKEELRKKLEMTSDKKEIDDIIAELEILKDKDAVASLDYLARTAHGTKLIASLKMDVDNMGLILQKGLPSNFYLEHLIGFSRHISYFFKIYVNRLCRDKKVFTQETSFLDDKETSRRYVSIVYAGGDDLFVIGAWDEVSRLAIDIGNAFKKYTCYNLDLGISAGVTLHHTKVPVYQMVQSADKALKVAKKNLQPCWQCYKEWLECPFLGSEGCKRKGSLCLFYNPYLHAKYLQLEQMSPKYEKRHRLNLVAKWQFYHNGNLVNEVEDYILRPLKVILPAFKELPAGTGIIYRLLRLMDTWHENGELYLPKLVWIMEKFKTQLKRKKIKTEGRMSLYTVLDEEFHYFNPDRLSRLHIPLMWMALWLRGGKNA